MGCYRFNGTLLSGIEAAALPSAALEKPLATCHDPAMTIYRGSTKQIRDLTTLRRVRDRIDRDYAQPLNVEALAQAAHMSAGHLSRQFKAAYGESVYSYLMTRRVERAMALFRRGDISVTDACFTVGCSSLGTFSTRFSELVGMSPAAYRREQAKATEGMPSCVARVVTRPVRNQEAATGKPDLD